MQKSRKRSATDELPFQEPAGRQVAAFCRHLQNVNKRFKAHVQGNMSQCYEKACVQYLEYVQGLRQKYPAVKLEDAVKGDLSVHLDDKQRNGGENVQKTSIVHPMDNLPSADDDDTKRRQQVKAPFTPSFSTYFASSPSKPIQGPSGTFLPPGNHASNLHQEVRKSTPFPSSSHFHTTSTMGKLPQVQESPPKLSNIGLKAGLPSGSPVVPPARDFREPSALGFSFRNQGRSSAETADLAGFSKAAEMNQHQDQGQDEQPDALETSEGADDLGEPARDDVVDLLGDSDDQIDSGESDSQNMDPTDTRADDNSAVNGAHITGILPDLPESEEEGEIEEAEPNSQMKAPKSAEAADNKFQAKHSPIVWGSHLSHDQEAEKLQASSPPQSTGFDTGRLFSPVPSSSPSFSFDSQTSFPTPVGLGKGQPVENLFRIKNLTGGQQSSTIGDSGAPLSVGLDLSRPVSDKAGTKLQSTIKSSMAQQFAHITGGNQQLEPQFSQGQSTVMSSGLTNQGFTVPATKAPMFGEAEDTGERPFQKRRLFNNGGDESHSYNEQDEENNPKTSFIDVHQPGGGHAGNVNPNGHQGIFGAPSSSKPFSVSSQSVHQQAPAQPVFGMPGFQAPSNGFSGFNNQDKKSSNIEVSAPTQMAASAFGQPSGGHSFGGTSHGRLPSGSFLGSSAGFGQTAIGKAPSSQIFGNGQPNTKFDGQISGSLFPSSTPASSSQGFSLPTGNGVGFTAPAAGASEQDDEVPKEKPAVEVKDSETWEIKFQTKSKVYRQLKDGWQQIGLGVISVRIGKVGDNAGKGWMFFTTGSGNVLMCNPLYKEMQVSQKENPKMLMTTGNFLEKETVAVDPKAPTTVEKWVPASALVQVGNGEVARKLKEAVDSAKG